VVRSLLPEGGVIIAIEGVELVWVLVQTTFSGVRGAPAATVESAVSYYNITFIKLRISN